ADGEVFSRGEGEDQREDECHAECRTGHHRHADPVADEELGDVEALAASGLLSPLLLRRAVLLLALLGSLAPLLLRGAVLLALLGTLTPLLLRGRLLRLGGLLGRVGRLRRGGVGRLLWLHGRAHLRGIRVGSACRGHRAAARTAEGRTGGGGRSA